MGLDPLESPLERIFQYLLENGVLKFFERAVGLPFDVHDLGYASAKWVLLSNINIIFSDLWGVVGIAYGSTVCDHSSGNKYKQSINEWRPTLAAAGQLIAHEMGHNLGN